MNSIRKEIKNLNNKEMRSIANSLFKTSVAMILGATLFTSSAFAGIKGNQETSEKMNVNIASATGKNNYNLKVENGKSDNVFVSIYDSNNNKLFTEKLNSRKSLKKKYRLGKYNSKSFFFVIESGNKVHTEEVM